MSVLRLFPVKRCLRYSPVRVVMQGIAVLLLLLSPKFVFAQTPSLIDFSQWQENDQKGTIDFLTAVIGNPPTKADKYPLRVRAQAYCVLKDWTNAIRDYDTILQMAPKEATAYYNRGVANLRLEHFDKAIADFQSYLKLNPGDLAQAYAGLGISYLQLKKYPEAVEAYTQYIALKPDDSNGFFNRGVACYNLAISGNDKSVAVKGIEDFNAFLKMAPPTGKKAIAAAHKLIAELSPIAGVDPLTALNNAIANNPADVDPLVNRGIYYLKQSPPDYDKAITDFTTANIIDPKDASILYNRALVYTGKKEWPRVINDSTAALAIKPDYLDALFTRADAYFYSKDYPAAIADYRRCVTLSKKPSDKGYALKQIELIKASITE